MKVSYDPNTGDIKVVARDSEQVPSPFITVPDDETLLLNPNKFYVDVSTQAVVRRPYLELSTDAPDSNGNGIPDAPADGTTPIVVTVRKLLGDGTLDSTANDEITVRPIEGALAIPNKFNLTNGVGSFQILSTASGRKTVVCTSSSNVAFGLLAIEFI
jgi:hypothetical protein